MIVGVTGTQNGMTAAQKRTFDHLIRMATKIDRFHHGVCIGSDEEAHNIVRGIDPNIEIWGHPSNIAHKTANVICDKMHEPLPPLKRNRIIVAHIDQLIATPKGVKEELRSGTWTTVRYMRNAHKRIIIISPDGSFRIDF